MLTQFDGICFKCKKEVKAGKGDFQSRGSLSKSDKSKYQNIKGKWLVRCFNCKNTGNY